MFLDQRENYKLSLNNNYLMVYICILLNTTLKQKDWQLTGEKSGDQLMNMN